MTPQNKMSCWTKSLSITAFSQNLMPISMLHQNPFALKCTTMKFCQIVHLVSTKRCISSELFLLTYWLSCSNIIDAFIMSFLCTGPILMPAYWNTREKKLKWHLQKRIFALKSDMTLTSKDTIRQSKILTVGVVGGQMRETYWYFGCPKEFQQSL
jgi:hypothetical protein